MSNDAKLSILNSERTTIMKQRIYELDYLRGFALLGILLVNIEVLLHLDINYNANEVLYRNFLNFMIEDKFFAIFSFLFGIGFYIFMTNAFNKGYNAYLRFVFRLVFLAIAGVLHQLLQPGEALTVYAVFGIILIPFFKFNKYLNLLCGVILLVVILYLNSKVLLPLPYFILGVAASQFKLLDKLKQHQGKLMISGLVTLLLALCAFLILYHYNTVPTYKLLPNISSNIIAQYTERRELFDWLVLATSPIISLCYVSLFVLFIQTSIGKWMLKPLQYYGQMALTNYIGQTVIILSLAKIMELRHIELWFTGIICVAVYMLQLILSWLWLKYFNYGPLEYLWKMVTYQQYFPLLKK